MLSPWLYRAGIVTNTEYGSFNLWLVWPSLGLLVAGSFLPLLLEGGAIVRRSGSWRPPAPPGTARGEHRRGRGAAVGPLARRERRRHGGRRLVGFGMNPLVTLLAVALALVLANVSARATGETDFSPGGEVGTVSLISLYGNGSVSAVMGGSVSMGVTSQTSQMLWAFRAGRTSGRRRGRRWGHKSPACSSGRS